MQEQITALGSLDDEAVRACKRYETTLDQSTLLEKGHEKSFEILRDAVTSVASKRKCLQKAKTALLELQGFLSARADAIASLVASKPGGIGDFFSTVIERARREAAEIVGATSFEVGIDLGALARVGDNLGALLEVESGLKAWRKSFDERSELVEAQCAHLVNAAKVAEQIIDKAISKLRQQDVEQLSSELEESVAL